MPEMEGYPDNPNSEPWGELVSIARDRRVFRMYDVVLDGVIYGV